MKQEGDNKTVDLLVIITRLHAYWGASEDEFMHEWSPPGKISENAGPINDAQGLAGFWALSADGQAGLMVIHGHPELLGKKSGSFEATLLGLLSQTKLTSGSLSRLAVFAHGKIPETGSIETAGYDLSADRAPECTKLKERFCEQPLFRSYSLSNDTAALVVPQAVSAAGISEPLLGMLKDRLKLKPAVDRAVRGMQHIVLEMRLWCDLYYSKKAEYAEKREAKASATDLYLLDTEMQEFPGELKKCIDRLNDRDHWKNRAVTEVRGEGMTLLTFLQTRYAELSKSNEQIIELGAEARLKGPDVVMSDLMAFFQDGSPSAIGDQRKVDAFLRALSARLETLIIAAARKDEEQSGTATSGNTP